MKRKELIEIIGEKPEMSYPIKLIDTSDSIPVQMVYPISTYINDLLVPGLAVTCNSKIFDYYKIGFPPPSPNLQFRMMNLYQKSFAIEVVLYFELDKIMRLLLDPFHLLTRRYLELGGKDVLISFHFVNQDNGEIRDSITTIDDEQIDWFMRNYSIARSLKSNMDYDMLATILSTTGSENKKSRSFSFYSGADKDFLIENCEAYYKIEGAKYSYEKPE